MSLGPEKLKVKQRVELDSWTVKEQLCLAAAVLRSGDQNWMTVSRMVRPFGDPSRPPDWYSQKNCAVQYSSLLENVETPKRKKRNEKGESQVETPSESILRKLTQERMEELQRTMQEMRAEFMKFKDEIAQVKNGVADDRLDELCQQIEEEKKQKEKEAEAHALWLKERENMDTDRTWKPPVPPVFPHRRKVNRSVARRNSNQSDPSSEADSPLSEPLNVDVINEDTSEPPPEPKALPVTPTSPLLTSLLKSPSPAPTSQSSSILHSAITSHRGSSPTITSLLNSAPGIPASSSSATVAPPSAVSSSLKNLVSSAISGAGTDHPPVLASSSATGAPTLSMLLELPPSLPGKPLPELPSTLVPPSTVATMSVSAGNEEVLHSQETTTDEHVEVVEMDVVRPKEESVEVLIEEDIREQLDEQGLKDPELKMEEESAELEQPPEPIATEDVCDSEPSKASESQEASAEVTKEEACKVDETRSMVLQTELDPEIPDLANMEVIILGKADEMEGQPELLPSDDKDEEKPPQVVPELAENVQAKEPKNDDPVKTKPPDEESTPVPPSEMELEVKQSKKNGALSDEEPPSTSSHRKDESAASEVPPVTPAKEEEEEEEEKKEPPPKNSSKKDSKKVPPSKGSKRDDKSKKEEEKAMKDDSQPTKSSPKKDSSSKDKKESKVKKESRGENHRKDGRRREGKSEGHKRDTKEDSQPSKEGPVKPSNDSAAQESSETEDTKKGAEDSRKEDNDDTKKESDDSKKRGSEDSKKKVTEDSKRKGSDDSKKKGPDDSKKKENDNSRKKEADDSKKKGSDEAKKKGSEDIKEEFDDSKEESKEKRADDMKKKGPDDSKEEFEDSEEKESDYIKKKGSDDGKEGRENSKEKESDDAKRKESDDMKEEFEDSKKKGPDDTKKRGSDHSKKKQSDDTKKKGSDDIDKKGSDNLKEEFEDTKKKEYDNTKKKGSHDMKKKGSNDSQKKGSDDNEELEDAKRKVSEDTKRKKGSNDTKKRGWSDTKRKGSDGTMKESEDAKKKEPKRKESSSKENKRDSTKKESKEEIRKETIRRSVSREEKKEELKKSGFVAEDLKDILETPKRDPTKTSEEFRSRKRLSDELTSVEMEVKRKICDESVSPFQEAKKESETKEDPNFDKKDDGDEDKSPDELRSEDSAGMVDDKTDKVPLERPETPSTEDDKTNDAELSRGTGKKRLGASTPSDSVPNSPAASITDEEREYRVWKKSIMLVYGRLATHKYASLFLRPITDDQAPGYSSLVHRPIDLLMIKKNIETGVTRTTIEFQRDVMLMFCNSIMYNKSSHFVHRMASQMQEECLQHIQDFLTAQMLVQTVGETPLRRETRTTEANKHKDILGTPGSASQDEGEPAPGGKRKRISESEKGSKKRKMEDLKELSTPRDAVKEKT